MFMKKKPLVFALIKSQSLFMTGILSLLSHLSVLILGIVIAISTSVARWNNQWDLFATVQVMQPDNAADVKKIIDKNKDKFETVTLVSTDQMTELLKPWVSAKSDVLGKYLPQMYEIKINDNADMEQIAKQFESKARFLPHSQTLEKSIGVGWRMIFISFIILALTITAITFCISYITKNTAMLHKRELEILNQIGASDNFVINQMRIIVTKICIIAGTIGLISAIPVLLLVLSAAQSARVGLMAMMGLNLFGWILLILMPIAIIIFANWTTKKTTLKILENS